MYFHLRVYVCLNTLYVLSQSFVSCHWTNQLMFDIPEEHAHMQAPCIYRAVYHVYSSIIETCNKDTFKAIPGVIFTEASDSAWTQNKTKKNRQAFLKQTQV